MFKPLLATRIDGHLVVVNVHDIYMLTTEKYEGQDRTAIYLRKLIKNEKTGEFEVNTVYVVEEVRDLYDKINT